MVLTLVTTLRNWVFYKQTATKDGTLNYKATGQLAGTPLRYCGLIPDHWTLTAQSDSSCLRECL